MTAPTRYRIVIDAIVEVTDPIALDTNDMNLTTGPDGEIGMLSVSVENNLRLLAGQALRVGAATIDGMRVRSSATDVTAAVDGEYPAPKLLPLPVDPE